MQNVVGIVLTRANVDHTRQNVIPIAHLALR